jgi:outer membrane protein TolC
VQIALKNNTELIVRLQQEHFVHGQTLAVGSALTPNIEAKAYTRAQEINLAAMGFKPGSIKIPGFNGTIPEIVKVNTTSAQVSVSQTLFNVPAYFLFRAAQKAGESANWATLSARGSVVLAVGGLYLQALADDAQVRNARALVKEDELVYEHAKAAKEAGVGINLDVLRAQVELQNEQQQLIRAENAEAKDKIQLNRVMGQPAGQELTLVDTVPFAEFDAMPLDDAMKLAFERRKDLRGLEAQLEVAQKTKQAVKYERLPTLGFDGTYGVLGETTGLYHGVFTAEGKLSVPLFLEATLRGQREVAEAQMIGLQHQIDGRKASIEGDIRSSMLDVQSAAELVKVARSNVELAGQALGDATQRFTAGVDDNLPVVRAQSTLVGAQTRQIQAEFQYNYAKLQLARNTGVVETEYKQYLGH